MMLGFLIFSLAWMYWNDVLMMYWWSIGDLLMINWCDWCMIVLAMFVLNSWRLSKVLLLGLRGELASGFLYEQNTHLSLSLYIFFFTLLHLCGFYHGLSAKFHITKGVGPPKEAEPPVNLSDRRLGKAVRLIRLAATTAGATEVSELDAWEKRAFPTGSFSTGKPRWIKPFEKKGVPCFFVNGLNVKGKFQEFFC